MAASATAGIARQPGDRRGPAATRRCVAMIGSLDPIRFEFTFDEASYLRYERLSKAGQDMTSRDGSALLCRCG